MYPKEYIAYLAHFHGDRDYFECHEIIEEYWKRIEPRNKFSIWVGFIQLAVSSYHHRRGNLAGAKKTAKKALTIFNQKKTILSMFGIEGPLLLSILEERLKMLEEGVPYKSFNLPLLDPILIKECSSFCEEMGETWGKESQMDHEQIIHRHLLRDRTDIIHERQMSMLHKKGNK